MNLIKADIIDYMGKYANGVLVLLSIVYEDINTEGTIFYTDDDLVLTIDERIEERIGCPVQVWSGYKDLLESILIKLVPYSEIVNRLDEVDFDKFVKSPEGTEFIIDEVDPSKITFATQSNLQDPQ